MESEEKTNSFSYTSEMRWNTIVFVLASLACQAQTPRIREQSPLKVPELPALIRTDLAKRHCTLPLFKAGPVHGHFYSADSTDWAVVCDHIAKNTEEVLVYRADLSEPAEAIFKSTVPYPEGCWNIDIPTQRTLRNYLQELDPVTLRSLPPLIHQVVEISFCSKLSEIDYFTNGHWQEFEGGY